MFTKRQSLREEMRRKACELRGTLTEGLRVSGIDLEDAYDYGPV
jgi:hypothetical protein